VPDWGGSSSGEDEPVPKLGGLPSSEGKGPKEEKDDDRGEPGPERLHDDDEEQYEEEPRDDNKERGKKEPQEYDRDDGTPRTRDKCPTCGYLNVPGVVTCFSCRTNFIKKTEEEKSKEFEKLAVKVGYRQYFSIRGKRSRDGNARKNAIKQRNRALETGYKTIQEYFMKNEKHRTQKMVKGYDEHSIQELDEIAAIPAQEGGMSSSDRLANFGRTVERLEQGGGTNTTRGEYELYPNYVSNKDKGKQEPRVATEFMDLVELRVLVDMGVCGSRIYLVAGRWCRP
jgi:hypothetical protein